ncbi:MAG TPA: anthranilate synthase component I [Blastocatellia bacterium]|nr:anthranilate synthase component I [Blastocatellia bacterium]
MFDTTPSTYEKFLKLAHEGNLVPIVKRIPADLLTPVLAYLKIEKTSQYAFLLESIEGGEKIARYSFIGCGPNKILRSRDGRVEQIEGETITQRSEPYLSVLRELSDAYWPVHSTDLPPFTGGAVGYLGYDSVRWFERIPDKNPNDLGLDDAVMMFFNNILVFDHVKHQIYIIANTYTHNKTSDLEEEYRQALREIDRLHVLLTQPFEIELPTPPDDSISVRSNMSQEQFETAVSIAKDYITAGDAFQIVLSQRLETRLTTHPFRIYRALRMVNPSPYMFYLKIDDTSVLGASPEMLVRCTGKRLEYRPIAGTQPRGKTEDEDAQLEKQLLADEKECAEHIMLVDLGRNDLGRVSKYGTVKVEELMFVERYSHVMHLVSALSGELRDGLDRFDALAACFPAGTLTGAPKVRAMEIIDELEPTRRGVYGGAVMYLDYSGNLDSCIAIRTMVVKDGKAYIQAGAGVVYDSVPEREHRECLNKAMALVQAIEIAEQEL